VPATVIGLTTRMVLGWQLAVHMRTSLITEALQMTIPAHGLLHGLELRTQGGVRSDAEVRAQLLDEAGDGRSSVRALLRIADVGEHATTAQPATQPKASVAGLVAPATPDERLQVHPLPPSGRRRRGRGGAVVGVAGLGSAPPPSRRRDPARPAATDCAPADGFTA